MLNERDDVDQLVGQKAVEEDEKVIAFPSSPKVSNPLAEMFGDMASTLGEAATFRKFAPSLHFELQTGKANAKKRHYKVSRFVWTSESWRYVDAGLLETLISTYVPHIGKQSFYEMESLKW